jgi:ABC-type transporter Mla subunit MlaD
MSSLETLIKLHRWQLDEQRRRVTEFETLADQLRAEMARLDQEERDEKEVAGNSLEASRTFSDYAKLLLERRQKLHSSIQETDNLIIKAREILSGIFEEVKRYETAAANRLLAQHKKLERLIQADMDEVALEGFRRKTQ